MGTGGRDHCVAFKLPLCRNYGATPTRLEHMRHTQYPVEKVQLNRPDHIVYASIYNSSRFFMFVGHFLCCC